VAKIVAGSLLGQGFRGGVPHMSFAEIILRISASIGGWLIFIGLCLTLAVVPQADCDPASDELWRGTLFFAVLAGLGLIFVRRGFEWRQSIRWFALPAGGLALYAAAGILPALMNTSLAGESLCAIAVPTVDSLDGHVASTLERAWPMAQLAVLGFGVVEAVRYWRAPRGSEGG
jgi:hypothetical protein